MIWKKLGHIFTPDNNYPWMYSHASNTVAKHLYDDIFRIYFSCRNKERCAHIGYIDININPPFEIIDIAKKPVLSPGAIGTFDDSGVSLSCFNTINGEEYLYYLGWNLGVTVPWRNAIGLAIFNKDSDKFERFSQAPLLDRNHVDPYSISYPFVMEDEGQFRMWYGSNLSWGHEQNEMAHIIKYASSKDGVNWLREGIIALNFKDETEYAMSRPFVIKEDGIYKMWYSYRGKVYKIGYAESLDAINWTRKDELAGIDVSPEGWDSEMVCYPFIFDHKGKRYLLYNGNKYGLTGFGIAELISG